MSSRGFLAIVALGVAGLALAAAYVAIPPAQRRSTSLAPGVSTAARDRDAPRPTDGLRQAPAACSIQLRDVTAETGVTFQHTDGSSGAHYIMETVTSGLAVFDFDGDELADIYFPNGAPLPGAKVDRAPRHALYRNLGNWRFRDVTEEAKIGCAGYGLGAAAADYDNDGWRDLYVSNFGPKVLYHNDGNGTFSDVTVRAGVADGDKLGAGACFLDIDRDGELDLFVANYLQFAYEKHVVLDRDGYPEYVSPKAYPPEKFALFRNRGDGTFMDVTVGSGIANHPGKGMGAVCADYDQDGDTDIFVLNDVYQNFCFQNDGSGHFEEIALLNGFKYNGEGVPLGSMGVDCADYDNDGHLDLFQTSYEGELPVLFRNLGGGLFEDCTTRAGAGQAALHNVKWGCGFVDFDNDGHRDLFIAMGHLQDQIEKYNPLTSFRARNVLLRNRGDGTFEDVSNRCGDGLLPVFSSRGAAFDDLDNDGDVDVVVLNARDRPTILRNMLIESGSKNHWLQIRLQGVKTNRDGVGAGVRVVAGDLTQIDEVHGGRGYQSHWGLRLHFGLGHRDRVDRIEVRWIGGGTEVVEDVPADRRVTIVEGRGIVEERPCGAATL